ncbi:MAG: hypothetical protein WCQ47_07520 [bacterium]
MEKLEIVSYVSAETGTTIQWHRFRDEDTEWGVTGTWETSEVLSTDEEVLAFARTMADSYIEISIKGEPVVEEVVEEVAPEATEEV